MSRAYIDSASEIWPGGQRNERPYGRRRQDHQTTPSLGSAGLTGREVAVLELLAGGLTAYSIGRRLQITARTAEKHLERVYSKLDVHDRLTAVLTAQRLGIVPPEQSSRGRAS
jgi:DNA-binding NarL/FixJ family response regulator